MAKLVLKNNLRKLLSDNGLKIIHLSKKTNISHKTLGDWLAGSNPRNLNQVKSVADYFKVSVDYLCFGAEIDKSSKFEKYQNDIHAGIFEVILKRVKNK